MITKKQRKASRHYNAHRNQQQHFHTPESNLARIELRSTWLKRLFRRLTP